jgi:hypothetical protein
VLHRFGQQGFALPLHLVRRLRQVWPEVAIYVRADAGFRSERFREQPGATMVVETLAMKEPSPAVLGQKLRCGVKIQLLQRESCSCHPTLASKGHVVHPFGVHPLPQLLFDAGE